MDPRRAVMRLNVTSCSPEFTSGGRHDVTREDVMTALGGVNARIGQALLLAAWMHDEHSTLRVYWYSHGLFARASRRWHRVPAERLQSLAALAVHEVVGHQRCEQCKGRGQVGRVREEASGQSVLVARCGACLGFGIRGLSDRERARRVGIDAKSWRLRWQDRYRPVLGHLLREHEAALRQVRVALTGE